ncbi:MAG: hypothetical protein HQ581_28325 [Planctomycetes bacterium]|nr:hypothetical protein [Planctomycetota bacterium]
MKVETAKRIGVPDIAPWRGQKLHTHHALAVTTLQGWVERGHVQSFYCLTATLPTMGRRSRKKQEAVAGQPLAFECR